MMPWVAHRAALREVVKHRLNIQTPLLEGASGVVGLRESNRYRGSDWSRARCASISPVVYLMDTRRVHGKSWFRTWLRNFTILSTV